MPPKGRMSITHDWCASVRLIETPDYPVFVRTVNVAICWFTLCCPLRRWPIRELFLSGMSSLPSKMSKIMCLQSQRVRLSTIPKSTISARLDGRLAALAVGTLDERNTAFEKSWSWKSQWSIQSNMPLISVFSSSSVVCQAMVLLTHSSLVLGMLEVKGGILKLAVCVRLMRQLNGTRLDWYMMMYFTDL